MPGARRRSSGRERIRGAGGKRGRKEEEVLKDTWGWGQVEDKKEGR